jgi:hypothetical protein
MIRKLEENMFFFVVGKLCGKSLFWRKWMKLPQKCGNLSVSFEADDLDPDKEISSGDNFFW